MKCIIVGSGRMGRRHIQVVKNLGYELVGLHDISRESLEIAKDEYQLSDEILTTNLEDLFVYGVPDCAIISTTADSHESITCLFASKGVSYILVEKPMATSVAKCLHMINVCASHGTKLAINHQMRFLDQYRIPKSMLTSEAFGGMKSMTVIAGNFGFSMNAIHYFEAFRYMTDEIPYEVTAWFSEGKVSNPRGERFEDRAGSIRVTTRSGKVLYMEIGDEQGHGIIVNYFGRNGFILVNELTGELKSEVRKSEYWDLPTTRYGMPADALTDKIKAVEVIDSTAAVLKALISDEDSVTGEDGLLAVKVLVAAYESVSKGGLPVKIDQCNNLDQEYPWA
ncbi:Gfo/Idh/MocA family oxidoreductase [Aquirufa sp. OSTEICH-129V]|uniref:Gfo/Idh/MocA family oxidoreductase n=1 Tax=Aquirufa avitistagni TaxID=3104728 RepID=A0ABW6DFS8_9BACT